MKAKRKSIKAKLNLTPKADPSILNAAKLVELALKEDLGKSIGKGDVTSLAIIPKAKKIKAQIRVKDHCVLCGMDLARKVVETYEKLAKVKKKDKVKFEILRRDGSFMQKHEVVATLEGPAHTILACERTMLNFLARLSGVSTAANRFGERLMMHKVKLLDTRKTLGGYRGLEKYAERVGGGNNHRKGLYDMFLIKDNHIAVAGNVQKALDLARKSSSKNKLKTEIEIESLKQLDELLALKELPDMVMLDNMSFEEMEIAVEKIRAKSRHDDKYAKNDIKIEASGGVTLENISEIAKTGVDYISVGTALTLGAKPIDFTVDVIG